MQGRSPSGSHGSRRGVKQANDGPCQGRIIACRHEHTLAIRRAFGVDDRGWVDRGSGELRRAGRRRVGWPWLILGTGLAVVKADAFAMVLHHRVEVIIFLGLGLAFSVLRTRPVEIAVTAALLLALFIAIGTVLHARQDRARTDASDPRPPSATEHA